MGIIFSHDLKAQIKSDSNHIAAHKDVDLADVFRKIFKRHQSLKTDSLKNVVHKKVNTSVLPAAGYSLQTGLAVLLSADFEFAPDTSAGQKSSNILTNVTYTQYNQILFPLSVNIWTKKNKLNVIFDYRFLKYPSTTYGIGPNTAEQDGYTLDFNYLKLHQSVLKKVYKEFYAGAGFYFDYFWKVREVNPPAGVKTSFQEYGAMNKEVASGIALKLLYDSRQNQINPAYGTYANMTFRPNFTFLGSDNNWQSLQIDLRKYVSIFGSKRNTLALWSFNWFTLGAGKPPYLLLPSTGWDDQYNTGRGYIQSRFRDRNMVYGEMEYRLQITNNGLLGAVVFANAETFSAKISNQFAVIAPGYGFGLRVKLNKNSKANLCLDYGFGLHGSRGLFVNLGEVF